MFVNIIRRSFRWILVWLGWMLLLLWKVCGRHRLRRRTGHGITGGPRGWTTCYLDPFPNLVCMIFVDDWCSPVVGCKQFVFRPWLVHVSAVVSWKRFGSMLSSFMDRVSNVVGCKRLGARLGKRRFQIARFLAPRPRAGCWRALWTLGSLWRPRQST